VPAETQLKNLCTALEDFYAPGLDADTFVSRAFRLTSRLIPCALNSHGEIEKASGMLAANFDCHPPGLENAFAAFGQLMGKYAPFRFDPTVNGGRPFSARDFYSASAFRDMDIYSEVYRPMGYVDHCFVHVPSEAGKTVFVGFLRDGRAFDHKEKEMAAMLQPHLANGRQLALAVTAAKDVPVTPEIFGEAGFTPRESDVIYWLTQGKSNEEIATLLHIRADSVSRHLHAIYEKMGVEHRIAAACHALTLARQAHARRTLEGGVSLVVPTR
jgi:DNA-binding CsgD family transcriptional regulator